MSHQIYRHGKVHLLASKCSTCIYRPGNLMDLRPGRVEDMERDAIENEGAIVCHKTLDDPKTHAICRGFWDVHRRDVGLLQAAERMGAVVEDATP